MTNKSAEPALYDVADDGAAILFGARDRAGYISFPFQELGSLESGDHGSDLTRVPLSGHGTVRASATVWRHNDPTVEVPYTVASISLDEGPLIRGVMADLATPTHGTPVRAITIPMPDAGDDVRQLRFEEIR
ncbi:Zn-ribbon domain-containing OB-fold protein [Microbacterium koreense]|uniref:Zn-ribbon domain-containing OB-fold protein n=1 Tax=Microbacterium koreense TaxID=323761 RepID=A0ABW2ZRU6_9MICO